MSTEMHLRDCNSSLLGRSVRDKGSLLPLLHESWRDAQFPHDYPMDVVLAPGFLMMLLDVRGNWGGDQ
jgi:hypothetical protein